VSAHHLWSGRRILIETKLPELASPSAGPPGEKSMCKRTALYFGAAIPIILAASVHAQPLSPITMSSQGFNCTTPAGGQTCRQLIHLEGKQFDCKRF
jgi:hypothetical protein